MKKKSACAGKNYSRMQIQIRIEAGFAPALRFLELGHIDGLGTFLALNDIKLDFLAFLKSLEAFAVDSCIVYEYVVSF